jgi:hypothetical protein
MQALICLLNSRGKRMAWTQQSLIIRGVKIPKSPQTPPNTPREPAEQHLDQRTRSSQFLHRFFLTTASPLESEDLRARSTVPEPFDGSASRPAGATVPLRARTLGSEPGSAPARSLLASVLKGSPTAGSLRKSISLALASAGDAAQFAGQAGDCLEQALQLAEQGVLDVATRCRLGDLLHHCRVVQELFLMEEPGLLTGLIGGLLELAEYDSRQEGAAKLAAAKKILGRIDIPGGDADAVRKARAKVDELAAKVKGQKAHRASAALQCWGLTHSEIIECLRDNDALDAFIRVFDASALHPQFERRSDGRVQVASFAPIVAASSADVADMASAVVAAGKWSLALHLLAARLLGCSLVNEDDDAFQRLLGLCATRWRKAGKDDVSGRTLFRIAQHVRLLIDCGLIRGGLQTEGATRLLEEISLPSLDVRLMRLDDMASVCRVLQAVPSNGWFSRCQGAILRVAAEVAMDCAEGERDAIEQEVRHCDELGGGRWHSVFLANMAGRRERGSQIKAACATLLAHRFPFTIVRSSESSALCWESDPPEPGREFTWKQHGDAFMAFAHARLDQSSETDPLEVQQWFDIVRMDCRPERSGDRARLLALAMRAIGRSRNLLDGSTMRDRLGRFASEPGTVNQAMALCGADAFQLCVELAVHPQISPASSTIPVLLKHMLRSPVFVGLASSVSGKQMLEDLLARTASDPSLLKRKPMQELLRLLIGAENARPASRKLLEQPVLREALLRSDKEPAAAVLECLLLMPLKERMQRAAEMGFTPPADLSILFAADDRSGRAAVHRRLVEKFVGPGPLGPRLRIAALGAAMADSLGAPASTGALSANIAPLADGLLRLHEAFADVAPTDWCAQHLVDFVRLTLRLIHERPGETSLAFFRVFPLLNDPAEDESMALFRGRQTMRSEGRAIRAKGKPGLFAFSGLLTCLYLIEEKPLPVAESFEAASLARLMCAALWLDAGHGMRCRQQLGHLARHAHRVQHWLLPPTWFSSLRAELADASATLPG